MALADTAELAVKLTLGGNFNSQLAKARRGIRDFEKDSSRAFKAGQQIGTGIRRGAYIAAGAAGLLATQVALGLDSLVELEKQTAQTNAVLKSTGGIAGVTAEEVGRLSEKYESLNATIGDEVIREGQNLLLTFTNINKKAFEPALEAALNMNTALGKGPEGLTTTVKVVGKALNDPTKGLSALSRVGITFTKEQEKRIRGLQKEGKLYEAQGIIIAELDKRFGGSFLAGGGTTAGKVAKFKDSIDDLQRSLATALLPAIGNIADALSDLLQDPEVIKGVEDIGREIGKLFSKDNIKDAAKAIGDVFSLIRDAAPAIKTALGTVGTVLSTAFKAFTSLPPEVQQLLIGGFAVNKLTNGLITNIAGGIFGALKAMTVQAGIVYVNGGLPGSQPPTPPAPGSKPGSKPTTSGSKSGGGGRSGRPSAGFTTGVGFGGSLTEIIEKSERVTEQLKTNAKTQLAAEGHTQQKVTTLGVTFGRAQQKTTSVTDRVKQAALETKRETTRGASIVRAAEVSGTGQIVGAIRAIPAPVVNVSVSSTSVTHKTTVVKRYGPTGGSRNADAADSRVGPN